MRSRIPVNEIGYSSGSILSLKCLSMCLFCLLLFRSGIACAGAAPGSESLAALQESNENSFDQELRHYRLEIVSTTTDIRAKAIADKLKSLLGKPVYIKRQNSIWKVQIGGFENFQDIKVTMAKLKEIGIKNARGIDIRTQSVRKGGRALKILENEFDAVEENTISVYLDMPQWYHDYVKTEVPFVNYVRDRKQADVFIMMTTQQTGSGGTEYTLTFIGQQRYLSKNDTLHYRAKQADSEEITRRGIVRMLKIGLIPYVSKTPQAEQISVNFRKTTAGKANGNSVRDKWNYWVFGLSLSSYLNGEEARKSISVNGNLSADRVTPHWKIGADLFANYNERKYKTDEETILSITRSQSFRGLVVKSISDHWSAGLYGSAYSSIYSNTKLSLSGAPAVEYNVFHYDEATRREFRFLYRTGHTNVRYNEETIYEKLREKLYNESLSVTFEVREPWGSERFSVEGSHYFHDIKKYRVEVFNDLSLNLFEGFSLNLWGNVSKINDQLSLPRAGASEEEILLHRRQLATQYDYYVSVGLRYTFGSIYSNIVNPRFGRPRGRGGY